MEYAEELEITVSRLNEVRQRVMAHPLPSRFVNSIRLIWGDVVLLGRRPAILTEQVTRLSQVAKITAVSLETGFEMVTVFFDSADPPRLDFGLFYTAKETKMDVLPDLQYDKRSGQLVKWDPRPGVAILDVIECKRDACRLFVRLATTREQEKLGDYISGRDKEIVLYEDNPIHDRLRNAMWRDHPGSSISQHTFLHFLKALHQSSKASPIFNVINIAAMVVGMVPSVAAMVNSAVVNLAALAAIEVQGNQRTNDILAQMNEGFFKPRGLFCLIFAYKPESRARHERIDISETILGKMNPGGGKVKQTLKNSGRAAGKTHGEMEMPEAAPLIFPALDELAEEDAEGKKKQSGMKRKGKFVANYFDKRAQAAYVTENPDSTLVAANPAQHKFASRFADPNHPVNSGHPISLLTGGYISPKGMQRGGGLSGGLGGGRAGMGFGGLGGGLDGRRRGGVGPGGGLGQVIGGIYGLVKGERHEEPEDQQMHYDNTTQTKAGGRGGMSGGRFDGGGLGAAGRGAGPLGLGNMVGGSGGSQGQEIPGLVKRVLTENVLYLMVVNMPNEDEMAAARVMLEERS